MKNDIRTKSGLWTIFLQNKESKNGKHYIGFSVAKAENKAPKDEPPKWETSFLNGFVDDLKDLASAANAALYRLAIMEGEEAAERSAANKANGDSAPSGKYKAPSTKPVDNTPDPDDKIPF